MSRYEDALDRVYEDIGETEYGSRRYDLELPKDIEILREAVEKAEKYNELFEKCLKYETAYENIKDETRALYKENKSLKETLRITDASGLSAMIQNIQAERDEYKEENQILKEGIKALSNYCSYNNERRNIQEDLAYIEVIFDAECIEEKDDGDYEKIKAMLEVINE